MGLSFFNAERARKERLEKLNKETLTPLKTPLSDEEPTSPELIGVEVGNSQEAEQKEEEIKEQPVKKQVKTSKKRKQ